MKTRWISSALGVALGFLPVLEARGEVRLPCGMAQLPTRPAGAFSALANLPPADTQAAPTVIDLLFLYTPEAVTGAGAEEVLHRRIRESIEEANYVFTNSQVNVSIQPVFIGKVEYEESGDIILDLGRLASGQGAFRSAPALRNDYKADVVCLVTELENQGIGGVAWDIPALRGNASTAFMAVRRQALGRGTTLAHELGHLLGCAHDREHAGDLESYRTRRSYIFGHRLEVEQVTYIDLMAYEPGLALPFFSNPRIELDGVPLGVAEGSERPADTARAINETAPYVAAYRRAASRIEFASAGREALRSEGSLAVRLVRTGDLAGATRVTVAALPGSTALPGVDYSLPGRGEVEFASGQSEVVFLVSLAAGEGAKTLRLALSGPAGEHGIGFQGEMEIVIRDLRPVVLAESVAVIESSGFAEIAAAFNGPATGAMPVVAWRLAGATGRPGTDYLERGGTLRFELAEGRFRAEPVRIALVNDDLAEADERFQIIFESTTHEGVAYAAVTHEVRIVDDDRPGALVRVPAAALDPDGSLNVAVRHDRKMLVWGSFSRLASVSRTGIALLNADGTVNESFRPPEFLAGHRRIERVANALIRNVRFLPGGQFLAAGEFARADGRPRSTLARLNADGSLDESFGSGLRFDGAVSATAVQPDGRILAGGGFENINGQRRAFIARLNADGSVDETFQPKGGPSSSWTVFVTSLAVQSDGKIVMGGLFEKVDGVDSPNLARLLPDGQIDPSFRARGVSGPVLTIELQADGKIVLAGLFDTVAGRTSRKLARLNEDGSIDESFLPPMPNSEVRSVISLPDRRMLINGAFTRIAGVERRFVALLHPDGTLDTSFDLGTGPDERLGEMILHGGGGSYLGGRIQKLNGLPAAGLAEVKFENPGSRFLRAEPGAAGTLALRAFVFPGARYPVEASSDWSHWREAGLLESAGFGREGAVIVPQTGPREFFRLKNTAR